MGCVLAAALSSKAYLSFVISLSHIFLCYFLTALVKLDKSDCSGLKYFLTKYT